MIIRITSCSIPQAWYKSYIGQKFEVIDQDRDFYDVREPEGYKNIVDKNDAEIVESNYK